MILKNNGTVYTYDRYGEPALERAPLERVRYISGHMAILDNGELWYWGTRGAYGISGTGIADRTPSGPVKVMDNVVNVWGENCDSLNPSAFALTESGALYSWGLNQINQLGYQGGNQEYPLNTSIFGENAGSFPYQDSPRRVDISDVADIANVGYTTFVLKNDGTLWVVGSNVYSNAMLPEEIEQVDTFTQVLSGVLLPSGAVKEPAQPQEPEQPETPEQPQKAAFSDVPESAWYASYVSAAAEAGPENSGEIVPASAPGEPWYQGAYDYCIENSLFTSSEVQNLTMNQAATRFQMVDLLDRVVPDSEKVPVHSEVTVPDLAESAPYGDVVYRWYRAGITEGDQDGRFNGNSAITRGETAAIFCRLAGLTQRV